MDNTQQEIEGLKKIVDTARQEIELAVMFHETWRPAAYDTGLHTRIGTSYAAHAFQIIRLSLRRELLLALTRVWDTNKRAVRMSLVADRLRDKNFFEALVQYRAERIGLRSSFAPDAMRKALTPKRDQILELIGKYSANGTAFEVFEKLKMLRHQHLAHRQLPKAPVAPAGPDTPPQQDEQGTPPVWATDDEIETFYQDNLEIMRLLLSLVQGLAFDLSEATDVYKHHAKYFWASARGERTEGHPDYHPPPSGS
ncbi:AbiU2 domain-containing protein [Burkholderia gladioli]